MAIEQPPRPGLQSERKEKGLVYPEQIPATLLSHPQWVCWRYMERGEGRKPDKQPITAVSTDLIPCLLPRAPEQVATPYPQAARQEHYSVGDMELWERIFVHDNYGADHLRRFQGDVSLDRGDHSFTVIRLLNCLARWTHCDPGRIRSMMLMSPLANDKWFEKRGAGDWLDHQIADAIAYVSGRKGT